MSKIPGRRPKPTSEAETPAPALAEETDLRGLQSALFAAVCLAARLKRPAVLYAVQRLYYRVVKDVHENDR